MNDKLTDGQCVYCSKLLGCPGLVSCDGFVRKQDAPVFIPASAFIPQSVDMQDGKRGGVLLRAIDVINGERQDQYGNPEDSFDIIARVWQWWLDIRPQGPLNAGDTAIMMVLFKIARESNQKKLDNIVDAAGYLGIYGDMVERNNGA